MIHVFCVNSCYLCMSLVAICRCLPPVSPDALFLHLSPWYTKKCSSTYIGDRQEPQTQGHRTQAPQLIPIRGVQASLSAWETDTSGFHGQHQNPGQGSSGLQKGSKRGSSHLDNTSLTSTRMGETASTPCLGFPFGRSVQIV